MLNCSTSFAKVKLYLMLLCVLIPLFPSRLFFCLITVNFLLYRRPSIPNAIEYQQNPSELPHEFQLICHLHPSTCFSWIQIKSWPDCISRNWKPDSNWPEIGPVREINFLPLQFVQLNQSRHADKSCYRWILLARTRWILI